MTTTKRRTRIDPTDVIDYRLSHSYAETLQEFGLTPGRFFTVVNEAYRNGDIGKDGREQCLVIERPTLNDYFSEVRDGERSKLPHGTHLAKENNANLVEIVLEPLVLKTPETPVSEAPKTPIIYKDASREQKIQIIRNSVINHPAKDNDSYNGAQQFFYDHGLAGLITGSPHLRKNNSPIALLELYDKERKVGLFDRTQDTYLGRWEITQNGMWQGKDGKKLALEAIEDALWKIPGYRNASREQKIQLIRDHVINYKSRNNDKTGAQQFFYDYGLHGLMSSSHHLRKKGSPIALLELYDKERKVGLFDRTQDTYLCRWKIKENGMWKGKDGKELALEAIEDALWKIPGYRNASREQKIQLIRDHVINYKARNDDKNGALQFFHDHGLAGLMNHSSHLRKRGSPIALLELYDKKRGIGLFDKSKGDYLEMRERNKLDDRKVA